MKARTRKQKYEHPFLLSGIVAFFIVVSLSPNASAFEIVIKLTGHEEFPGLVSLDAGTGKKFDRLCLLGTEARGSIDMDFIMTLAGKGIPEGNYQVAKALPEEKWPTSSFSANGALRFVPKSESLQEFLMTLGKQGLALHARDFYPLAGKMTDNPKMIRFFSNQLFERLAERWGTLRISNWDMGRFHDFYRRNTESDQQWKVRVTSSALERVKNICAPLKVQRKPGGELE
ncbi:MAG: hypothetical protein HOF21_03960 [Nitrospina sp.]|nr:hypothetical protein [Nitrospina sp.]MBT5632043.1 hypothetical protein [Nitrospina sp.]